MYLFLFPYRSFSHIFSYIDTESLRICGRRPIFYKWKFFIPNPLVWPRGFWKREYFTIITLTALSLHPPPLLPSSLRIGAKPHIFYAIFRLEIGIIKPSTRQNLLMAQIYIFSFPYTYVYTFHCMHKFILTTKEYHSYSL